MYLHQNNDISKAIGDLIKDTEDFLCEPKYDVPALEVEDHTDELLYKYSLEAQQVLKVKIKNLVHQRNEMLHDGHQGLATFLDKLKLKNANDFAPSYVRVADLVNFFGISCNEYQRELALDCMVSLVNDLVKDDALTGTFAPISSIQLFTISPPKKIAIFFYGAVNHRKQVFVEQKYKVFMFPEGEVPASFEDIAACYYGDKFKQAFEETVI